MAIQGEHLGRDLLATPFFDGTTWVTVDLHERGGDLATADGVDALRQALVMRLLTERGELGHLGHAAYGSRLHELIGRRMNESNRLLARAYVIEAVRAEPRVADLETLELEPIDPAAPHAVRFHLQVRAVGVDEPVALAIEVTP